MQKIVMIHPNLFERGGAERKLILMSKELIDLGYEVDIIVKKYDKKNTFNEFIDDKLNIINLNNKSKLKWFKNVINILKKNDYDLIVAHNYPANIPVNIYNIIYGKNKKTVWVCNEVATLLNRKDGLFWKLYYKVEQFLVKCFDLIIANSTFTASSIDEYYNTKSKVIRSGVEIKENINLDNISDNIKQIVEQPYIFSISRIEKHKNIELLEKIAIDIKDINIIVAGKGNHINYIKSLEIKYKNIIYVGAINEDEKFYLYNNAKVFSFLPLAEPLGVTTMEALSQNTPVVAYNNGGPKEIILDKENGFLANNDKEFIKFIKFILDNKFTINHGKKYIQEKFSNKRMTDDFIDIFKKSIRSKI
jgi:glycosyltransferase involved in cell wall biosynthesis